jgi:hypothetical protein
VSLGAFEHFADGIGTYERYDDFFKMCHHVLPDDGVMLLHSIVVPTEEEAERQGLKRTNRCTGPLPTAPPACTGQSLRSSLPHSVVTCTNHGSVSVQFTVWMYP